MKFVLKVVQILFLSIMAHQMTLFAAQSVANDKDDKEVQAYTLEELQQELQSLSLQVAGADNESLALFFQSLKVEERSIQNEGEAAHTHFIKSEAKKIRYEVLKNEIKKEKDVISIIALGGEREKGLKKDIQNLDHSLLFSAGTEWNIYRKILLYAHLYLSFVKNLLNVTKKTDEELNACLKRVLVFMRLSFRQMEENYKEIFNIIPEMSSAGVSKVDQDPVLSHVMNFLKPYQEEVLKKNRHPWRRVIKTLEELISSKKAGSEG